jgi:hypothetical protein
MRMTLLYCYVFTEGHGVFVEIIHVKPKLDGKEVLTKLWNIKFNPNNFFPFRVVACGRRDVRGNINCNTLKAF